MHGDWISNEEGISLELHNYFDEIFKTETSNPNEAILDYIPTQVSTEMTNELTKEVTDRYVRVQYINWAGHELRVRTIFRVCFIRGIGNGTICLHCG